MRKLRFVLPLLAIWTLWGVFEWVVRVEPAWGQAVGYCGAGRPCKVASIAVGSASTSSGDISIASGHFAYFNSPTNTIAIQASGASLNIYGSPVTINNTLSVVASGTSPTWSATAASGSNGFACTTNGCRFDLGTGANDYWYSDGTAINSGGNVIVAGTMNFAGGTSSGDFAESGNVGTAGSGTGISTVASGYVRHFVHAITVSRTALTTAATTQDITIWTLPAKTRLIRLVANATAAFTGGTLTNMQVMCGPSAGSAVYLVNGSIFTINVLGDAAAEIGTSLTAATVADIPSMSATSTIVCRFTSTGANVNAATAGSVTFEIEGITYP